MRAFLQVLGLLAMVTLATCLTYSVDPQSEAVAIVSDKFLSVALDCSNIQGRFSAFNLTDPKLIKLVNHLSPMYFRIGGTFADRIVFSADGTNENYDSKLKLADITFFADDWLKVYAFTKNADVRLIFDLNSLLRNADGTWNPENAETMIKFSNENGIETDWQLGNEPDLYNAIYGAHVDATQLGNDYQTLRALLNKYDYSSSFLVGPDMFDVGGSTANQEYLSNFLNGGSEAIHAITWHQYYFPGKTATEDMFLNPATFNQLEQRTNVVKNVVNNRNKIWLGEVHWKETNYKANSNLPESFGSPMNLRFHHHFTGETSSAYNGGAANMSNRFLATFIWLDKLGLGAKMGIDVIIRQTIFYDYYALLDENYNPNPDWWLSIIYKTLVGSTVISINNNGSTSEKIRLYAHCAQKNSLWDNSTIVVFGINVDSESGSFNLDGFESEDDVIVYEFTAEDSLYSQQVRLNGEVLNLTPNYDLPDFQSKTISKSNTFIMPAYSIVFLVFKNTNVNACQS